MSLDADAFDARVMARKQKIRAARDAYMEDFYKANPGARKFSDGLATVPANEEEILREDEQALSQRLEMIRNRLAELA